METSLNSKNSKPNQILEMTTSSLIQHFPVSGWEKLYSAPSTSPGITHELIRAKYK